MAIRPANHLSEEELQQRIDSEKDADKRDKYRAILWVLQGRKRIDVAKELGVERLAIYKWIIRYNQEGEPGLCRKSGQGDKRTLTPDKVEKIKQWVTEEGVWTLDKMRIRLMSEEGISVTPQAIWYRLKESRWSWKTGRPSNPDANEQEQTDFKKRLM
ncbi:TPA: transposase [bacterium]|nr:transposase [bacterium]